MNEIEQTHKKMVAALKKPGVEICKHIDSKDCDLIHMTLGICGEAGELLDAVKKHTIYVKPLDWENIIEELGDLEFYMEGMRQILNIDRKQTLEANYNKLRVRYEGLMYSDKAAQERADKVMEPPQT